MKPAKPRVVFCTDGIYPFATGGMQKHSKLLIESLARSGGLDITVFHPHQQRVFTDPAIKEFSIEPIDEKKNYLLECYRYSQRVGKLLNTLEYDLIYSQGLSVWWNINQYASKLIVNLHGLEPFQAIGWSNRLKAIPFKWIFRYIFKHSRKIISLGGKLTGIIEKNAASHTQIVTIPNAIQLPEAAIQLKRQTIEGPIKVLFLARFASNKGIDVLFKAIELLKKQNLLQHFDFCLGGKGPLYEFYKANNPYTEVKLLGFVDDKDIDSLYQSHDLFLLPTLFEGMPTVVLEAMSWKMPVIVSDVGATAEQVDASNGYLVKAGSVEELVTAFLHFFNCTAEQKIAMGEASFQRVCKQFTWTSVAEQHRSLFYELVKN